MYKTSIRIIIIDKDKVSNYLSRKLFASLKIFENIITEEDPIIGVSLLDSTIPNLVLIDFQMLSKDNFDILKKLNANSNRSNIHIVVMYNEIEISSKAELENKGVEGFILKPLNYKNTLEAVDQIIRRTL